MTRRALQSTNPRRCRSGKTLSGGTLASVSFTSDGVTLPVGTIHVLSTGGWPASGIFFVSTRGAGIQEILYTSKTGTTFDGCTGGTGTLHLNDAIFDGGLKVSPTRVGDDVARHRPFGRVDWAATRGALWLPAASDPTTDFVVVSVGGPGPVAAFRGQKTTGNPGAWFVAIVQVGDGSFGTYVPNSDGVTVSPQAYYVVKTRACDGDKITFLGADPRTGNVPFSVDITLVDTPWTILHTFITGTFGVDLHGFQWLYCVGKADATTPEARLYNWFIPPMWLSTIGCNPIVWDDTNTYPITWAGAFPLAQAFSDTMSAAEGAPWGGIYAFETFSGVPLASNVQGTSFDPGEMPTYNIGTSGGNFVEIEATIPGDVVAGVPFDFVLTAKDAYGGGAGRFSVTSPPYGRAVEGFTGPITDGTENSNYAPGTSVERGTSGIYDVTGFKIKRAGLHRLRIHDRLQTGATPRVQEPTRVLPASPHRIFFNAFPQDNVGCGEELRMLGQQTLGGFGPTDYDPGQLQALDASLGWHDKVGKSVIQVEPGLPISFVVFDAFNNFCDNDSSSTWTLTLVNRSNYLGSPVPHLTGTLTRRAVNGLVTFPDVRVFGWGSYDLKIQGVGASSGISATWSEFLVVPVPTVVWNTDDEKNGLLVGAPTSFKFHYEDVEGNLLIPNRNFRITVSNGMRPGTFTGARDYTMLAGVGEIAVGGSWPGAGFFDVKFQNRDFTDSGAFSPSFEVTT